MIEFEFRGKKFTLYLSGLGLFEFYERYGHDKGMLDVIEPTDKDGYEATIWAFCELSRQGKLYRQFVGEEPGEAAGYAQMLASAQPSEYAAIKAAVIAAIAEGFGREHKSDEDEDPWLAEFEEEKQKKKESRRPNIFARLRRGSGSA